MEMAATFDENKSCVMGDIEDRLPASAKQYLDALEPRKEAD